MLNQTGIEKNDYGNIKQILIDPMNSTALSCVVDNTGVTADSDGVKMIKAGTPVKGSLTARNTPFKVTADGSGAVGVILHDVDVTKGKANSQVVIFGTIDVSKVDAAVKTMLTAAESNLKMIQLAQ